MRPQAIAAGLVLLGLAGCQIIGGFEAFQAAGAAGEGGAGGGKHGACGKEPGTGGSKMVSQVRGGACFWIDRNEVTSDDYAAFIKAVGTTPTQDAPCAGNVDLETNAETQGFCVVDQTAGTKPVTCVDWCDATYFCQWVGKRLCKGKHNAANNYSESEWYAACSDDGNRSCPYGSYDPTACNGACVPDGDAGSCATNPVGSSSDCTARCGARDMSGNVAEWVDECNGESGPCSVRGGSVISPAGELLCEGARDQDLLVADPLVGFRCCSDPG